MEQVRKLKSENYPKIRFYDCVEYRRIFDYKGENGCGFGFGCNKNGDVFPLTNPDAIANYKGYLNGEVGGRKVVDKGIRKYEWSYREPAIGECDICGEYVHLDGFTNTCEKCGADYNMSGQKLAPREQWGEETGEHWTDLINPRLED